tara:strand:+ start:2456 stop:3043 length:588 start_codon:yes stop_codon:yes gene_type:complete
MWHQSGSLLVLDGTSERNAEAGEPANLRLVTQDWSELTLEVFPSPPEKVLVEGSSGIIARRTVYERDTADGTAQEDASTTVELLLAPQGRGGGGGAKGQKLIVGISASPTKRSWIVRVHLRHPAQRLSFSLRSEEEEQPRTVTRSLVHLMPAKDCATSYFPLQGAGATPPCEAGAVAEFRIDAGVVPRRIAVEIV